MADCPLAEDCPSFQERIQGMGCQHYGDRGGAEWCNHYNQPIKDLKSQPVKMGEEVVVDVEDIHESGAGVGRTEDGFIVMVDGVLPPARAKVKITKVHSNHARADEIQRIEAEEEDEGTEASEGEDDGTGAAEETGAEASGDGDEDEEEAGPDRPRLGS
ncbi:MAG: TRAM domain-containing protein, partial [Haloarculaceae archaeon]